MLVPPCWLDTCLPRVFNSRNAARRKATAFRPTFATPKRNDATINVGQSGQQPSRKTYWSRPQTKRDHWRNSTNNERKKLRIPTDTQTRSQARSEEFFLSLFALSKATSNIFSVVILRPSNTKELTLLQSDSVLTKACSRQLQSTGNSQKMRKKRLAQRAPYLLGVSNDLARKPWQFCLVRRRIPASPKQRRIFAT